MKLLIANLSSDVSPGLIQSTFEAFGSVSNIIITRENYTDKYIAQLEMPNFNEASNAISQIDGKEIGGTVVIIKNKNELIAEISAAANKEIDEGVETKTETNAMVTPVLDINESARLTSENRRNLKSERRVIQSPLFSEEKGLVIDRRKNVDRRV